MITQQSQTVWPEGVVSRFLTLGGATVDLHRQTFRSEFDGHGHYVGARETDGFNWRCLGCDAAGHGRRPDEAYFANETGTCRDAANTHAADCRALPRPTA